MYRVRIEQDENPDSPADWGDDAVFLVTRENRYFFPRTPEGWDMARVENQNAEDLDAFEVLPLRFLPGRRIVMLLINSTWISRTGPTMDDVHEVYPIGAPVLTLGGEFVTAREYRVTGQQQKVWSITAGTVTFHRLEVWGDIRSGGEA